MSHLNNLISEQGRVVRSDDGTLIFYDTIGTGAPLILLHGLSETHEAWIDAGYAEQVTRLGFELILIDCRGHGQSDRPIEARAYSGHAIAADIRCVMDTLGLQRAAIMGHSLGGMAALATALHYPDRVSALVLNGAHPFAENLQPLRELFRSGLEGWLAFVEAQAPSIPLTSRKRIQDNHVEALKACIASDRKDVSKLFARLELPTLAICGEQDPRREAIRKLAHLPQVQSLVLPGQNHMTAFLSVEEIIPAITQFLQTTAAGSTITINSPCKENSQ